MNCSSCFIAIVKLMFAQARARDQAAWDAKMKAMSDADKQRALRMLERIMAAWLQGSVRGYVFNWHMNWQSWKEADSAKGAGMEGGLRLLQKIMAAWLAGSLRGMVLNWRLNFREAKEEAERQALVQGLNEKLNNQKDRDGRKRELLDDELERAKRDKEDLERELAQLKKDQPDIAKLQLENDALAKENAYLKAKLAEGRQIPVKWQWEQPGKKGKWNDFEEQAS